MDSIQSQENSFRIESAFLNVLPIKNSSIETFRQQTTTIRIKLDDEIIIYPPQKKQRKKKGGKKKRFNLFSLFHFYLELVLNLLWKESAISFLYISLRDCVRIFISSACVWCSL